MQGTVKISCTEYQVDMPAPNYGNYRNYGRGPEAIAIDCEMVGGGSDGTLDLCGRVCLIDEDENLIFHTYVQPQIPVTNYRYLCTVRLFVPGYFKRLVEERIISLLLTYLYIFFGPDMKSLV